MSMQELADKLAKFEKIQQQKEVTFFPQSQQSDFRVSTTSAAKDIGILVAVAILAYFGYQAIKGFSNWNPFAQVNNELGSLLKQAGALALSAPEKVLNQAVNSGTVQAAKTSLNLQNQINSGQDAVASIPQGQPGYNAALANYFKKTGTVTLPQYSIIDENAYLKWNAASGGGPTITNYANNLARSISQALLVGQANPANLGGANIVGSLTSGAYNVAVLQKANAQLTALNNLQLTPAEKAMGWASAPKYSITNPNAFLSWIGA